MTDVPKKDYLSSYRRDEKQKATDKNYRRGWDKIWKEKKKADG